MMTYDASRVITFTNFRKLVRSFGHKMEMLVGPYKNGKVAQGMEADRKEKKTRDGGMTGGTSYHGVDAKKSAMMGR